ncbi:helix-turn-helix transcriptional regulator [Planctomicrobium sp. SH527]|uniref:helix-turn-helix transcriptional regulator n=1 Tax=Planctomicrobium sp. SH527 TaxID=3448123 RepID=UPI003F5BE46F
MRDQTDHAFLTTLHRLQPATVQALCAATGVTATAIRQRLLRLQADGLITRGVTRGNRGRPFHAYSVTNEGLKSLGDDHAVLAAILWREVKKIEPGEVRDRVLDGVKEALVRRFDSPQSGDHAGPEHVNSIADRLSRVCTKLAEHGFDVDFSVPESSSGLPILREHNCPYHEIAEEDPDFCEFEQSVFAELLGTSVELTSCRQDGHGHCEFHVGRPS